MSKYDLNAWRRANRAKGLCWYCTAPVQPGFSRCAHHLEARGVKRALEQQRRAGLAPSQCLDCRREITSHDRSPARCLLDPIAFCDWCGRPRDPNALDEPAVELLAKLGHITLDTEGQPGP